jgi:protein-disulfide isomerase/cyclophilin family peptidyl-prolyl cis-trans isomerase
MKSRNRRRSVLGIGLILILVLSACGPRATPDPTAVPTTVPTATPDATAPGTDPSGPAIGDPSDPLTVVAPETLAICEVAPLPEVPVREVDDTDYVKGASIEDAEIVIYEYSDFQCPGCAGMSPVIDAFVEMNPDVALVYRHFPLDFHVHAQIAAEAAEAAGAQGKFWEMHDLLFGQLREWNDLASEAMLEQLSAYAEELDLDVEAFDTALAEGTYTAKVEAHYEEARMLGLPGTPSFIFDNVLFPSDIGLSLQGLTAFKDIIESQDDLFYAQPPAMTLDEGAEYEALLKTNKGDIRVTLLSEAAPVSVNNFIFLAEEDWYDGSDFFFVRDSFVAVTGDPTNSTVGYPGYYCIGETQNAFDRAGLLGMLANGQFFLTLGTDAAQLSGQFALIGQVTEGMDVLDQLARRVVGDPLAPEADVIESIEITKN